MVSNCFQIALTVALMSPHFETLFGWGHARIIGQYDNYERNYLDTERLAGEAGFGFIPMICEAHTYTLHMGQTIKGNYFIKQILGLLNLVKLS